MLYNESTARELQQKFNIADSTINGWRRRKSIPEMYAKNETHKIANQVGKPRNGGGRPATGRTGVVINFFIKKDIAAALRALNTNQTAYVNAALREKLNKELRTNADFRNAWLPQCYNEEIGNL